MCIYIKDGASLLINGMLVMDNEPAGAFVRVILPSGYIPSSVINLFILGCC